MAETIEWRPWPLQELALKTKAFEILMGGARGPGKTEAGIVWMLKPVHLPRFRGLVIRRNADDLKDWLDRARYLYSGVGAEFAGNPVEIRFRSGAKIRTGHLKDENAYGKYLGHEYQRILIEELTQIPRYDDYEKLLGSCRSTIEGLDARLFATTNPGGPGHMWVKERFIDPMPPFQKYADPKDGRIRVYIPGTYKDNPTLTTKDPDYIRWLEGLEGDLGKAWRDGDWDVFTGMFFTEFSRKIHVYQPSSVQILPSWPRFRSIDWGYASPMACYWHAVGPDQHVYTYREYYERQKLDVDAATEIAALTMPEERILYTVGDPQSFPVKVPKVQAGRVDAVPRYEVWADNGVPLIMGDSNRVLGWSHMREYLKPREYQSAPQAWWHISSQCVNLIRELGSAVYDQKRIEDIDADCSDHALESCRLGLFSRPAFWAPQKKPISDYEAAERQREREKRQGKLLPY